MFLGLFQHGAVSPVFFHVKNLTKTGAIAIIQQPWGFEHIYIYIRGMFSMKVWVETNERVYNVGKTMPKIPSPIFPYIEDIYKPFPYGWFIIGLTCINQIIQQLEWKQQHVESSSSSMGCIGWIERIEAGQRGWKTKVGIEATQMGIKASLVGGLEHEFYCPINIGNLIIPIDVHIFQRGGPTTNQIGFASDPNLMGGCSHVFFF